MFKKVFIPGGHGFLGKAVAKILEEKGVKCVSLSSRDGYDFRNFHQTIELFEEERFDAVIQCAAFVGSIKFAHANTAQMFYNNTLMYTHLMEAARLTGIKKYVNILSNCLYPDGYNEYKEEDLWKGLPADYVMGYGFSKRISVVQSFIYARQYGLKTVNLILPNIYGPGFNLDMMRSHVIGGLVEKFVEARNSNLPNVTIWGTGKPIRELLYIDDAAEAVVRALDVECTENPINIGSHKGISIIELANLIKDIVGYKGKIMLDLDSPDGVYCKIMNVERMRDIFNWMPTTKFREGIKKTVEWYDKTRTSNGSDSRRGTGEAINSETKDCSVCGH